MKKIVITNVIIFTVDPQDTVIPNGTVILEDGKISAVGKKEEIIIPLDADEFIDVESCSSCVFMFLQDDYAGS